MRIFTFSTLFLSTILLSSSSVKAYNDFYARNLGYDAYDHFQRRSDILSDLSTRDLVEELEDRLFRRTTPEEQLAHALKSGTPMRLTLKPDLVDLNAFKALAKAIIPEKPERQGSTPPSPILDKPAAPVAGKSGQHEPVAKAPVHQDASGTGH